VRLVTDRKRKSKGIAYIEFGDIESVPLAIALTGQRLLGVPIIVQMSHAEKNRLAAMQAAAAAAAREAGQGNIPGVIPGAAKLYVGSLHYNITEDMLRAIFEPFGKVRFDCFVVLIKLFRVSMMDYYHSFQSWCNLNDDDDIMTMLRTL